VYSPCGKVRTQAYCEDSTNGISCSDRNKNQTPLISATQLKKISGAKYCPCTSLYCSGVKMYPIIILVGKGLFEMLVLRCRNLTLGCRLSRYRWMRKHFGVVKNVSLYLLMIYL